MILAVLKFLQSLVGTLHSEGTPRQVGAGVALGAALGLTPLLNAHNLIVLLLLCVLNVSFGAGMLAWAIFAPIGFLLDPVFDAIGHKLLMESPSLVPMWTALDASPLTFSNLTNTVVLGSVIVWLAAFPLIWIAAQVAVVRYRAVVAPRVMQWKIYQVISASKLYNAYRWFRP